MPTLSLNASKKTKHTPAGAIPVDWAAVVLSDVIENLESGVSVSGEDRPANDSESGVLKVSAVSKGRFFPNENKAILPADLKRARMRPRIGAILVSRSNTPDLVGESARVPADYPNLFLPDKLWQVCIRPETQTDEGWLSYVLQFPDVRRLISERASGTSKSMRNISKPSFLSIPIPLPPLPEQIRIAAILSTWDRAIETLESLIAAKDRRKQALMQQLLTGRKRLPGFETPWSNVVFGDFLTESRLPGSHGAAARKLTVRLYGRGISEKNEARAGSSNTRYYTRRAGQFIYSKLDFLNGAFAIIPSHLDGLESTLDLPAFDIAPTVHPTWILTYLTRPEFYENCVGFAAGGRKARRVNPNQFLSIRLKLPSLPEQTAIASVLISADRELTLHRKHLTTLRTQKRGLMQKLLTGEIRTLAS
jgi:type I restriction enzyme S subunit